MTKTNVVHVLYLETWGDAIRKEGVGIVGDAAGMGTTEKAGVAEIGRALPPNGSITCGVMLVFHLAVPSRVIIILFKIGRLLR